MSHELRHTRIFVARLSLALVAATALCSRSVHAAADLPDDSGGIIVHLGCGDGSRTAELSRNERAVIHGLDTDPKKVAG